MTWLMFPFSNHITLTSDSVVTSLLSLTLLPPSYKDLEMTLPPAQKFQHHLPSQDPSLGHICKVPFAMEANIFSGSGD